MASLTKIMTCYSALKLAEKMKINIYTAKAMAKRSSSCMNGTRAGLRDGDILSIWDLLHGLMLPSGNDAAICLSEYFGFQIFQANDKFETFLPKFMTQYFVSEMNGNARKLGLTQTRFSNPHGLANFNTKSSALELGKLVIECWRNKLFRELVSCREYICEGYSEKRKKVRKFYWFNTHSMVGNKNIVGGKTGITPNAGPCLATVYDNNEYKLVTILLNSKDIDIRYKETQTLFSIGKKLLKNSPAPTNPPPRPPLRPPKITALPPKLEKTHNLENILYLPNKLSIIPGSTGCATSKGEGSQSKGIGEIGDYEPIAYQIPRKESCPLIEEDKYKETTKSESEFKLPILMAGNRGILERKKPPLREIIQKYTIEFKPYQNWLDL